MKLQEEHLMIRRTGRTTVYIDKTTWQVKICKRTPNGRQSVQVFPGLTRHLQFESYTYWPPGFELDPQDVENCQALDDLRTLLKKRSRKLANAV
jgi:hypothetical protein